MRKRFFVLIVILLLLTGCRSEKPPNGSENFALESAASSTQSEQESHSDYASSLNEMQAGQPPDIAASSSSETSETVEQPSSVPSTEPEPQKDTHIRPESEQSQASRQSGSTPSTAKPSAPDPVPAQPRAGAEETLAVAGKIFEYLNGYRKQEGAGSTAYLNGLAAYARLRSQQLVSNFAHDTADERAAATQLQYGEYIDPKDFGSEGEPYYRANAREAIAMAGYIGTVDEVAQSFARLIHDSAGHWRYVGAAEYRYMAVGVTYLDGMWYCDVAVAATNTDAL